ncbi:MAG: hypothetical protein ACYCZN_01675 [Candidatus Dormibacteria bacterium]
MLSLILLVWTAGVLVSGGMLIARVNEKRIFTLHPWAAYPLFLVLWPVAWLVGVGVLLIVLWALAGGALARRS